MATATKPRGKPRTGRGSIDWDRVDPFVKEEYQRLRQQGRPEGRETLRAAERSAGSSSASASPSSSSAPAPAAGRASTVRQSSKTGSVKDGFWVVLGMLALTALFAALDNRLSAGFWIAGLVVAIVGAIVPPLAIGFLALVLLYLLFTRPVTYFQQLQQLGAGIGAIFGAKPGPQTPAGSSAPSQNGVPLGVLRTAEGP